MASYTNPVEAFNKLEGIDPGFKHYRLWMAKQWNFYAIGYIRKFYRILFSKSLLFILIFIANYIVDRPNL